MVDVTWKEFKEIVESHGIEDDDLILSIFFDPQGDDNDVEVDAITGPRMIIAGVNNEPEVEDEDEDEEEDEKEEEE
jgi:hypothetical protein